MNRNHKHLDPNLRRTLWGFLAVIICIFAFAWLAFSQPMEANHPELKWMTFETDNFVIHYHDGSERTALVIAKIAEEIHPKITGLYKYAPDTKFHFIVKDTDDYANGAAYYYNNKMLIWCTALDYDLRGTHNWLRDVITHEYTHIIQLGAARKMSRKLPALYLQVLAYEDEKRPDVLYGYPNVLASYPFAQTIIPMWFAEGTAQLNHPELKYDFFDSHRDMQIRSRILEDKLLPLNEMEIFGKSSVGSESVYNHGLGLVTYIAETYGYDKLQQITDEASHIGRYDFNAAIERSIGINGEELYTNWKNDLTEKYNADTEIIRANLVQGEKFQDEGDANLYSKWSPDGETFYFSSNLGEDYFSIRSIYALKKGATEPELVVPGVTGPFDISADGKWLLFGQQVRQWNESFYSDLFLYNLETEKKKRITKNARASEPSFNADNSKIVLVLNHDGTKDIGIIDIPSQSEWSDISVIKRDEIKRLTDFNDGSRAYRPSFSPDGTKILYAKSRNFGRDIEIMNVDGSGIETLLGGQGGQRDPIWDEAGNSLYYSSDITGIYNLYRYDFETRESYPISNVLGGAFIPAINPVDRSIAYSGWTVDGYKLFKIESHDDLESSSLNYKRDYLATIPLTTYDDTKIDSFSARPYKPMFEQLFFVPRIAFDYGTFKPGAYIFSNDFLDKLSLFGGFSINAKNEFDAVALMDFKALRPTIFVEGYYLKRIHDARFEDTYRIAGEREDENGNLVPVYETFGVDYRYHLMLFEGGARMRLHELVDMELRASVSRYDAYMKYDDNSSFHYTYFMGKYLQAQFHLDMTHAQLKSNVHPRKGMEARMTIAYEDNEFITGFEIDANSYTLQEVFTPYRYWRFEGDATGWYNPVGDLVFQPRVRAGYLDKQVDPFMHLYGGGMHGMRGYSYYSMGGTRKIIGSLTARHPVYTPDRPRIGWFHFDGLFAGVFADVGDSWREREFKTSELKKDIGLEIRAKFYSWYGYPTALTLSAARGLDKVTVVENTYTTHYDPDWRFYMTLLFEFETIFPEKGTMRR